MAELTEGDQSVSNNQHTDTVKPKENLKQRAYLNSVTSVIDYGAQIVTKFVVTPFLVSGLGSMLFGVWNMLSQFTGYANLADIKVSHVLKWAIAKDRDSVSEEELREYVTATYLLFLCMLPFILMLGVVVVWFAPQLTGVGEEYVSIVRIATAILVLALLINKVFDMFESVLLGMNLSFKKIGVRAAVFVTGGILQVTVILLGYGLIALALVQVYIMFSLGITFYVIMKKHVPWFGFGKINFKKSVSFFKTSGWFVGWTGTKLLLLSTDKVLLGYLSGPIYVTQYVVTKHLANILHGGVLNTINGVFPGIGKLYGNKEYEKVLKVRKHVMLFTWLLGASFGSVIILFNESFISLWVGDSEYGGQWINFLILLTVIQYLFIQNDSVIIDATLELSKKVYFGFVSAIVSIVLMFILIPDYGISGLCISMILGRLMISIAYPLVIYKKTNDHFRLDNIPVRPLLTISILWFGTYYSSKNFIQPVTWVALIGSIFIFLIMIAPIAFFCGIDKENRKQILSYFRNISFFRGD